VIVAADQYESSPLILDPWAQRLLPRSARLIASSTRWSPVRRALEAATDKKLSGGWASFLCRKRYIDDQLLSGLADGIESVVILGAGYDTRAYRIPALSGIRVCEVDLPGNTIAKTAALRRCTGGVPDHVTLLSVDLETDDLAGRLDDAGFARTERTFYIWEAVTQYLTEDAARSTMEFLSGAAHGSRMAFTFIRRDFLDGQEMYGAPAAYREFVQDRRIWTFGLQPEQVPAFLTGYGWSQGEQVGPQEYATRYLKPAGRTLTVSAVERAVLAHR
jgi:methyltransferase (TIGR00027 family)